MLSQLLTRFGSSSEFVRAATSRGLPRAVSRLLEQGACHVCPDQVTRVLESRELLEQAALHVATGNGANLELSFSRINLLAECFETLELTRTTDIPDPFRRVWVSNDSGSRICGVALTCENDEIAVFCPADGKLVADEGHVLTIAYRGFSSTVEFQLRLIDSCLFPGGLMLHLSRVEGGGGIGRRQQRFDVDLPGAIRSRNGERDRSCLVLDISMGGLRVECERPLEGGQRLGIKVWLPDGEIDAFVADTELCWVRPGSSGRQAHGLRFVELNARQERRLSLFLLGLGSGGPSLLG